MDYITTIGLEIHAELKTKTKMFCACLNESGLDVLPNSNVCPICMGHPGTLPTINKHAVKNVLLVGTALGGDIAYDFSEFDRKNYFYPDIPKGYQISQYKYPLVKGGSLNGVEITRIHLEEDTGTNKHIEDGSTPLTTSHSLVDYNRAGVPLMELVTEPVIHSAKQAGDFAKELQLLLRTLGVSDAEMSRGEMRVEANISVSKSNERGVKVEVKNLNSFKAVEKAIEFEVKRHIEQIENGEGLVQETRGWDENKQITFSQRQKEDSHDYRYFPDPDLPKLKLGLIPEFSKQNLEVELPELPWEKRKRYLEDYKLSPQHAEIFVGDYQLSKYFDEISKNLSPKEILLASNYVAVDLKGMIDNYSNKLYVPEAVKISDLMKMINKDEVSSRGAKDILTIMITEGGSPRQLAEEKGLLQKNDSGELEEMLKKIIEANPNVVADYKAGKESALMFFVGQVMKESKGSANPSLAREIAEKLLK